MTSITNDTYAPKSHRLRSFGSKGFYAVLDQGLFSGTNFLVNIGLARWLLPIEYGAFSFVYAAFILCSVFFGALFVEPMLVFGPGKYKHNFDHYFRHLRRTYFQIALGLGATFALVASALLLSGHTPLAWGFFGVTLMSPFTLLTMLLRRTFYARFKPHIAAIGATLFFLSTGICFGLCLYWECLTLFSAHVCLAVSNLCALIFFHFKLQVPPEPSTTTSREVLSDHWRYGKWNMVSALFDWVPTNIYLLLLPLWFGLETSGTLKALMNLVTPLTHLSGAIGVMLLPILVTARGSPLFKKIAVVSLTVLCSIGFLFFGVVTGYGEWILGWLYAGKYTQHAPLLWAVALLPVFSAAVTVLRTSIKAVTIPRWLTFTSAAVGAFNLIAGLVLTALFGLRGAVFGSTFGVLLLALAFSLFFVRREHRQLATDPNAQSTEV